MTKTEKAARAFKAAVNREHRRRWAKRKNIDCLIEAEADARLYNEAWELWVSLYTLSTGRSPVPVRK